MTIGDAAKTARMGRGRHMGRWGLTAVLALPLLTGTIAVQAQDGVTGSAQADALQVVDFDGPEIVVTGDRNRDRAVQVYVSAVTVQTREQIARFADPVCPASYGLPREHGAVVVSRIREVAREAGIRVAGPRCRPNVVIMAADRGEDVVAGLRRQRPALFAGLRLAELRGLARVDGPVQAWQLVEERGADGRAAQSIAFIRNPNGTMMYVGATRQLNTLVASRLERAVRQDLALSVVIFDVGALNGLTLQQIGDYAAMRALAPTDSDRAPSGRTILALFRDKYAGAAPADALTGLDSAYLRAVYATDNRVGGRMQQANIIRAVGWDLANMTDETMPSSLRGTSPPIVPIADRARPQP